MDFQKNINLLIFDFDGTLHTLAIDWLKMRNTAGIADSQESLGDAIERLKQEKDEEVLEKITRLEAESIENQILDTTIKATLDRLRGHFQLAILSRNSGQVIREFLLRSDIDKLYVVGREDVTKLKPNPEGVVKILDYFNCKPKEAILIGDTSHDILAAQKAGVNSIIVGNNYDEFIGLKPLRRLTNFSDLPKALSL